MASYIKYNQLSQLREAAKNGDEKAKAIIQNYLNPGFKQSDLDSLVSEYYTKPSSSSVPSTKEADSSKKSVESVKQDPVASNQESNLSSPSVEIPADISSLLDKELDGVIDQNEVGSLSFSDFLKKKKKDLMRSKKNSDYFKAFDPNGRANYLATKEDEYAHKFDNGRKENDRKYRDMDGAITSHSKSVSELLDDGISLDTDTASKAYDEITGNEGIMNGFSRLWDQADTDEVKNQLSQLCKKYGKQNVMAALNTLRSDNSSYKSFSDSQYDEEGKRYSKQLESLLK